MEAGYGMTGPGFNGGLRDKNISAGVGFGHFGRRDAG